MSRDAKHYQAALMLVFATAFWSLSFPTMKAVGLAQQSALPETDSWFVAALCIGYRFGAAGVLMLLWSWKSVSQLTASEVWQGVGLGLFGGTGLVLQMDGLAYCDASTSAFLTQCYCVIIPVWVALLERRWPSLWVVVSCLLVVVGVAVLARVNWQALRLGRGEWETLIASVLFTGQILWLQRPRFTGNNVNHFSLVMFLVIALCGLAVAARYTIRWEDWVRAYQTPGTLALLGLLVVFCTLGGYLLMNYWQTRVSATEAGLIYCTEPVFASLVCLFLPGWFSPLVHIHYVNEHLTLSLMIGGALITGANVILQLKPPLIARGSEPEA